ncbi:uncharacterized protein EI90DRAFT_3049835 [Cantharellus anzutake]|uniref:uncharacterized protein n=1 Tax=Cantharellus anzutake TaxID=1750568 RepID=UPI001904946A|nr:uncharacterized protein EI90DRAFT_3049835 [Cantharellus anzutake]KAF8334684.1 hypothetical protein EI90DRAFT_3049835 [Cantharellus anzutake]
MDPAKRRSRTVETRSQTDSVYAPTRAHSTYEPLSPEDDPFSPPIYSPGDAPSRTPGQSSGGKQDTYPPSMARISSYDPPPGNPRTEPVKMGDEETGAGTGWDVYADFNNSGPRYLGAGNLSTAIMASTREGYRALTPDSTKRRYDEMASTTSDGPVEMVTVPAFGPEWRKDELWAMSTRGRAEERSYRRGLAWKEWTSDRRGLFGKKWLTRKVIVWFTFGLVILIAVSLALFLPRVPSFGSNPNSPLTTQQGSNVPVPSFTNGPVANFTFPAALDLEMDTGGNIIPIHINNIHAEIYLIDTNKLIATGDTGGFTRSPGKTKQLNIDVRFNYAADNTSDQTWALVHNACKSSTFYPSGNRPGLNLFILLTLHIRGLINPPRTSTSISNVNCPIELPTSSA